MKKILLVDFDGVISNGKFYDSKVLGKDELSQTVQRYLFAPDQDVLIQDWMRGAQTYQEVHEQVSDALSIPLRELNTLLEQSVKEFVFNHLLLDYVDALRRTDWKVYMYTDNMDIFDKFTVPYHGLQEYFDAIYSSSAYGYLKFEDPTLFSLLKQEQGILNQQVYLIDDKIHPLASQLGIKAFHYDDWNRQKEFETWLGNA
jgi:FMN phosphatase YigB (HAD superfamily)